VSDGQRRCRAEVIGFDKEEVLLLPLDEVEGVALDAEVVACGGNSPLMAGAGLLGRAVDAFGEPIDGLDAAEHLNPAMRHGSAISPLERAAIDTSLRTGVAALDLFLPLGLGQRVGVFAGSGVGKSTLLGMCAQNLHTDVSVVALVGERGREVSDFLRKAREAGSMERTVLVAATADEPPLRRVKAVHTAHAIAEHFSKAGKNVLLIVDSITRLAMAQREIGLAAGEPATYRGYTPSVFAMLPRLAERCGNFKGAGSITAIYSVLVEGDDLNDPIADHMRAILDGHIVLDRKIAAQGRFPAIDLLRSVSRLEHELLAREDRQTLREARALLAAHESARDLIEMGAYSPGSNSVLDRAIAVLPELSAMLVQDPTECSETEDSWLKLRALLARHAGAAKGNAK
jgi:flagellum-specific ATP synthase